MHKTIIALVVLLIVVGIGISIYNESNVATVEDCKVLDLQQQQLISGGGKSSVSTQIRYLVITDKETFIVESSLLNGKFNNSDIYWRLRKDSTYTFKVSGVGKSALFDYRNILEVVKN